MTINTQTTAQITIKSSASKAFVRPGMCYDKR